MNTAALAQSAYARTTRLAPSARDTEYRAFARVTTQLSEYTASAEDSFPALADAAHQNLRLWTRLATDVAGDGNGLPQKMRVQILSLAEFTRAQTVRILKKEAGPEILVEINTAIMRGLKTAPDAEG